MAVRPILIRRPPQDVWRVLCDGRTYARWVVGTTGSRPLDDRWPAEGSAIRYTAGAGPLRFSGRTVVRRCEPGKLLELEAQSRPLGSARIAIDVRPWGENTLVIIDEHPLTGPGGRMHNRLSEAVLQLRHRRMLKNFARLVEETPTAE